MLEVKEYTVFITKTITYTPRFKQKTYKQVFATTHDGYKVAQKIAKDMGGEISMFWLNWKVKP